MPSTMSWTVTVLLFMEAVQFRLHSKLGFYKRTSQGARIDCFINAYEIGGVKRGQRGDSSWHKNTCCSIPHLLSKLTKKGKVHTLEHERR
jgi:hypothetical protein